MWYRYNSNENSKHKTPLRTLRKGENIGLHPCVIGIMGLLLGVWRHLCDNISRRAVWSLAAGVWFV